MLKAESKGDSMRDSASISGFETGFKFCKFVLNPEPNSEQD